MMNVVIVDHFDGKPHIRWGAAVLLACLLGVFTSVVAAGTYYALARNFSPVAAMVGFIGPFIMVGSGIIRELKRPQRPASLN